MLLLTIFYLQNTLRREKNHLKQGQKNVLTSLATIKFGTVLISPEDKEDFVRAIKERNPGVEIDI
jgi:hypothetical protein